MDDNCECKPNFCDRMLSGIKNHKGLILILISILLLISIGLNIYFLTKGCVQSETFCTCQEAVSKRCPSPQVLSDLYNKGILTETTNLVNTHWKSVMP